jgi:nitrogen-specific signal transduction histidine kinase/CheY-like chemotaxis protein
MDITERKVIEQARESALIKAQELQQQLHQAQKMEGIGRLAGGIAHDFNNLLSVILGYAELIDEELPVDSPLHSQIRTVSDAANRASGLTRQLLSFARRQPMAPLILSLNTHIEDMSDILRPLIGEDIRFQTHLRAVGGKVRIDAHQLEQILVNLVVNARDAMPQGGALTIETAEQLLKEDRILPQFIIPEGSYISLSVSDTGTGMTEEVKARLYEPFFTTKEFGKGTGLGLATVYGIVKQNQAYIVAASEVGKGTTFTLYFPRAESDSVSAGEAQHSPSKPRGAETILVVEDEPALREMIVLTLRRNGYVVLQAQNGMEALEIADAYPGEIHLLLTDAIMPVMGGKELAEQLRRQRPAIQILIASGYTEDRFADIGVPFPYAFFLAKPFTPGKLLETVREVIAK